MSVTTSPCGRAATARTSLSRPIAANIVEYLETTYGEGGDA